MRVAVNLLDFAPGCTGDEMAYLRNVLDHMRGLKQITDFVLVTDSDSHDEFGEWPRVRIDGMSFGLHRRFGALSRLLHNAAQAEHADCILSSLESAPARGPVPLVVYAMDIALLVREATESRWRGHGMVRRLRQACARARAVLAPSQAAQRTFMDFLDVPLNKVIIAPPGVAQVFADPQPCFVQKPYILVVGNTEPAMNVKRTAEAFRRMQSEMKLTFVVVGKPGKAEPKEWPDQVIRFDELPSRQLAALYQHSELFLCPAFFPASAMRVLEAMRAGTRVVAARTGGIPEIAGQTPEYFDPQSGQEMIAAIRRVLKEPLDERQRKIREASVRATNYTWENCAVNVLKALERV